MKLFIDTANVEEIRTASEMGVIAGVTTNPSLIAKEGRDYATVLKEIAAMAGKPFILKGIMTVKGAEKALEAGAAGIVVSNHGGRVLDQCPATAEVLPAIVDAVGG